MGFLVGVDIGGTFTDCAVVTEEGSVTTGKVPSTPHNLSEGFFGSISSAAGTIGLQLEDFLQDTTYLKHGATVGINTLVSRSGAKVGLLTTKGHGDSILIMNGAGRSAGVPIDQLLHVPQTDKPEPLVPRDLICEITERVDFKGETISPLNETEVRRAVSGLLEQSVDAIAVCFFWSFINPTHERRAKEIIQEMAPHVYVSLSSELVPKIGEYQRTATTVINSYIGPRSTQYVQFIQAEARKANFSRDVLFMQVAGGVTVPSQAAQAPVLTLQSGPVAGVIGAGFWGDMLGYSNIINTDMGGTTFDVSIIHDGQATVRDTTTISQYEIFVPAVDVQSIGAGGGSLVWVDEIRGTLRVGPESAGADPGPVCYGRGGTQPTVTDADVVQGFVNPENALGGSITIDVEAARTVIADAGRQVGLGVMEAAAGVTQIIDFQMADLIRKLTIERGLDPRDFVLFAYGGAGPVHVGVFAKELGIKEVVIPLGNSSSVWSALGAALSDHVRVYDQVERQDAPFNSQRLDQIFADLEQRAAAQLKEDGILEQNIFLQRSAGLRYKAQVNDLEIPVPGGKLTETELDKVVQDFEAKYEAVYGKGAGYREAGIELASLRVNATGQTRKPEIRPAELASPTLASEAMAPPREVYWLETRSLTSTPVYLGERLVPGNTIEGPAIIEFSDTTVVVRPDQTCHMDTYSNLILNV